MNLAIYKNDEAEFNTQGLGILKDVLSARTVEEVQENGNVKLELELEYPSHTPLSQYLKETNFIKCGSDIFEIFDVEEVNSVINVTAQAYDYRYMKFPFNNGGKITATGTPQQILTTAMTLVDGLGNFSIYSDVDTVISIDGEYDNLGKLIEDILSQTKMELQHGFNKMSLLKNRGHDSDLILRDDKNVEEIRIKHNFDEVINKVIPLYKQEKDDKSSGDDYKAGPPLIPNEPFKIFKYWRGKTVKFDNFSDSYGYFEREELDKPKVTVEVQPRLTQEEINKLSVFDRVTLYSTEYDFTKKLRLIKLEKDVLDDSVLNATFGDVVKDFISSQSKKNQDLQEQVKETDEKLDQQKEESDKALKDQQKKVDDYQAKIQKDVDRAQSQISNYLTQRNSDTITLIGSDGLPVPGLPPIKAIQSTNGMLINSLGFSWSGNVLGDNTGRFRATEIYGNLLEGTTIKGGIIRGGQITGDVYVSSSGGQYFAVLSTDYGLSVSNSMGSVAITSTSITINGHVLSVSGSDGHLYLDGGKIPFMGDIQK
ncbi:phage tail spike protein [Holzapfeliella sp. He02]|uniref:Phage tail spike protein n=1 Tax=Holzapfeliella saturejae TaxID=3082953 RepID=A0ABU8SI00_9LACO